MSYAFTLVGDGSCSGTFVSGGRERRRLDHFHVQAHTQDGVLQGRDDARQRQLPSDAARVQLLSGAGRRQQLRTAVSFQLLILVCEATNEFVQKASQLLQRPAQVAAEYQL